MLTGEKKRQAKNPVQNCLQKCLGINLTKDKNGLSNDNLITIKRETEENTRRSMKLLSQAHGLEASIV